MRPSISFHRSRLLALVAMVIALAAFPLGALASHQFADVPDTNAFHADISAIADAGVTLGCGGGNYCPKANVTREQMAAFLNRLGALGAGKTPVVNADKLDGNDSADFLLGGDIVTTYGPSAWQRNGTDASGTIIFYDAALNLSRSGAGNIGVQLSPAVPTSEHGVAYGLASVTYCADLTASQFVDYAHVAGFDAGTPNPTVVFIPSDDTNRTAYGCHTLNVPSPTAVDYVTLYLLTTFSSAGDLDIDSATFTWTPLP